MTLSSLLAKQLGSKKTIARISNTEFLEYKDRIKFRELGIDFPEVMELLKANGVQS